MMIYHKVLGQGPHVVFIHGWAFHSGIWEEWVLRLKNNFTVHLIDLPGFGQSKDHIFSNDLKEVINQLLPILPAKARYLGWSLGGLLAMSLALYEPERVENLVTFASTPYFLEEKGWPGVASSSFFSFKETILKDPRAGLEKFIFANLGIKENQKMYWERILNILFQYGTPNSAALLNGLEILEKTDLRDSWSKISCPQLHFGGDNDFLAKVNPDFPRKILENSGHFFLLTHIDFILPIFEKFQLDYDNAVSTKNT